jgi:PAS domain S-box-containing protein
MRIRMFETRPVDVSDDVPIRREQRTDLAAVTTDALVRLLQSAKRLRVLPIWIRYVFTTVLVLISFAARYWAGPEFTYPSLPSVIAIIISSIVFDRGSGFLATVLSGALSMVFFYDATLGALTSVAIFILLGLFIASVVEALRLSVEQLAIANEELALSRNEVRREKVLLETMLEANPDPMYIKDLDGRFVLANSAYAHLLNAPLNLLIGKRSRDFRPAEAARTVEDSERRILDTRTSTVIEEQMNVSGQNRWYQVTRAPWYGPEGKLAGVIGVTRDVHDTRLAQERVKRTSEQRQTLLQDISHRIKNHFQSLVSMLNVEKRNVSDPEAREILLTVQTRLSVLSRLYDRLQVTEHNDAVVLASDFVEALCDDLRQGVVGSRPIALWVKADRVPLNITQASVVGLFINEGVTNAIRHAFPGNRSGSVTVLCEQHQETCRVQVSDDGVGIPNDVHDGTGTQLLRLFASQLSGTFERSGHAGTTLYLRFPIRD